MGGNQSWNGWLRFLSILGCTSSAVFGNNTNRFVSLRHGQSQANIQKLIASDPTIACRQFGLTDLGQNQANLAAQELLEHYNRSGAYEGILIVSSDLLRAKQTAETVAQALQTTVQLDIRLRERRFGSLDGTSDENYQRVWDFDQLDSSHEQFGVESVDSVYRRSVACVRDLNTKYENHLICLVAHGDVLQILQCYFEGVEPKMHRSLPHLETATPRYLQKKE